MKNDEVTIRRFSKDSVMTVTVRASREFKVRVYIASKLITWAGYVMGCGSEVIFENTERDERP